MGQGGGTPERPGGSVLENLAMAARGDRGCRERGEAVGLGSSVSAALLSLCRHHDK